MKVDDIGFIKYLVEERIEIWCKILKFNPNPSVNKKIEGMTVTTYVNCKEQEVVYCMLHGVGHSIPKLTIPVMDGMIVDFFMKHKKQVE